MVHNGDGKSEMKKRDVTKRIKQKDNERKGLRCIGKIEKKQHRG